MMSMPMPTLNVHLALPAVRIKLHEAAVRDRRKGGQLPTLLAGARHAMSRTSPSNHGSSEAPSRRSEENTPTVQ